MPHFCLAILRYYCTFALAFLSTDRPLSLTMKILDLAVTALAFLVFSAKGVSKLRIRHPSRHTTTAWGVSAVGSALCSQALQHKVERATAGIHLSSDQPTRQLTHTLYCSRSKSSELYFHWKRAQRRAAAMEVSPSPAVATSSTRRNHQGFSALVERVERAASKSTTGFEDPKWWVRMPNGVCAKVSIGSEVGNARWNSRLFQKVTILKQVDASPKGQSALI
jgi:hypothetical protein